ncbi:MAG: amidohydrolase family protein [Desulfovibrio sp.]|jgi:predicted TIM-barrel fold metal-dependent hydrolase|nr:amidohydrolase family protein [Desulfovibrio sp.]
METPVIDFHIHLVRYEPPSASLMELMDRSFPTRADYEAFEAAYSDPEAFVRLMTDSGLDYGVILAEDAPLTTGRAPNELVAEFCAGREQLIPFCTVNPHLDPEPLKTLKTYCGERGFKGLKLYPTYNHFYPNEAKMYPLYGLAQEMGVPVLFHTGSSVFRHARIKYGNPIFFDDVAQDFPRLNIVLAHGGRGAWYDEAMTMVRLHRNVSIDVTGLPVRKLPQYFPDIDRFSDSFLFGTDWPQVVIKDSIAKFSRIGLSPESREKILGGNAARLLGLI